MIETATVLWILLLLFLFGVAIWFLLGAAGIIAVEQTLPDEEKDCICKQTRFAVYADARCPVHGESKQ